MRHWVGLLGAGLLAAQTPNVKLDDPAIIARGQKEFSASCGIYFCHGSGGQGGRAPRLAGRKFATGAAFKLITEGSPNRLMPPFQGQMKEEQIWSVIAYLLTLGPGGSAPAAAAPSRAAGEPGTPPHAADPNSGDPEAGRALFFDASNLKRCSACHQYGGRGTAIGPDLDGQAARPPAEILRDILEPEARLAVEPVTLVTKAGERLTGVVRQETAELIRLYDLSSLPPVLRTIYRDQIASTAREKKSPMPADYGQTLSGKQLLDLVSFLKGAPARLPEVEAAR